MKRVLSIVMVFVLIASCTAFTNGATVYANGDENIVFSQMLERAEAIVNYEWVPSQNIEVWNENPYNGLMYFPAGETVKGMPYTLFTDEVVSDSLLSLAQFKEVANVNYSATAACKSASNYAERTGPVYGSCCATFVSEVFGGDFMYGNNPRYDGVRQIKNSPYSTTISEATVDQIQPGDALSNEDGGHIVWVGAVSDTDITIYEQTPPIAQKRVIEKSSVTSDGYLIIPTAWGTYPVYTYITRSNELLQSQSGDYNTSAKYSTPIRAYTVNTGKTLVCNGINGTDKVNKIYDTDLCTIDALYESGWCHVTFPLDNTGGRTDSGFIETSAFFDFNKDIENVYLNDSINTFIRSDLSQQLCNDSDEAVKACGDAYIVGQTDTAVQLLFYYENEYFVGWVDISELPSEEPTEEYYVTYDANGGNDQPESMLIPCYISGFEPARDGYTFLGWSTNSEATSAEFVSGDIVDAQENIVLYAVWEEQIISQNEPTIEVESKKARPGSTVEINIAVKNNPGIASLKTKVAFDSGLTLTAISYNDEIGGMSLNPQKTTSPVTLNWYNGAENSMGDWIFATLTFTVDETATAGMEYNIIPTYNADDVYNIDEENINFSVVNGKITVQTHTPGDVNDDGKVNNKDLTRLFQYLSDWDVEVNEDAIDINGDGSANNKDLTRFFQYLSDWDVVIH